MDPKFPIENDPTEESFDRFWSHGSHHAPRHQFLQPNESMMRFVPREKK